MRAGWLVVAVVLAGCAKPPVREVEPEPVVRRPDPPTPPPKAEPPKKEPAPLLTEADAAQIAKDFAANPIAARTKYAKKRFRFAAHVFKVGQIAGTNVIAAGIDNAAGAYIDTTTQEELEKVANGKTFLFEAVVTKYEPSAYYGVQFEQAIVIGPAPETPPDPKRSGRKGP